MAHPLADTLSRQHAGSSSLTAVVGWGPGAGAVPLNVSFTAYGEGRVAPYRYNWTFGDNTTSESNVTGNTTHLYTTVGTFNATIVVIDASNASITATGPVVVEATPLTITSITSSPSFDLDLGGDTTLSTRITGAGGFYNITWSGLPTGCVTANSTSIACTPTTTGNWSVVVCASDPEGVSGCSSAANVSVALPPLISSLTFAPGALDANESLTLSLVLARSGHGFSSYAWSGLPPGCLSRNSSVLSCLPSMPGLYPITATVTDAFGGEARATVSVLVHSDPLVDGLMATPTALDVGFTVALSAAVSGGLGYFDIKWSGLPVGCLSSNTTQLSCSPSAACSCTITLHVTDSTGYVANGTVPLALEVGGVLHTHATVSEPSVSIRGRVWINTSVSGGVAPFEYAYVGLPLGCAPANSPSISCAPNDAGTFSVTETTRDSTGALANSTVNITVTSQATPPSALSATTYLIVGLILTIATACLLVALFSYRRRNRS